MDNIVSVIAKHADIDTRRALGFPPRKLNSEWKDFEPHPYGREIFKYFVNENILSYYEFWKYGEIYSEITTKIVPDDPEEHRWLYLDGAKIVGVVMTEDSFERYESDAPTADVRRVLTAGWPIFITQ